MKPVAAPSAATTPFEDLIGSSAGTQPVAAPASSASFAPAATLAAPTPFARPQSGSFTLDAISPSTITPTPYNSIQTPVASSLPNLASTPGFGSATGFTNPALLTPFASMQPRVESGATTTDIDMLLREPVPVRQHLLRNHGIVLTHVFWLYRAGNERRFPRPRSGRCTHTAYRTDYE
jgi:hypothetical protein